MYTCEEFLQDIIIENIPIDGEEVIHPTVGAMIIYVFNQDNSVLADPFMVKPLSCTLSSQLEGLKPTF